MGLGCVLGLNALQLLNAAAGSGPNPSSMPNSYGLFSDLTTWWFFCYSRDVVSAVLATAAWLAGWMSHSGIVSKQLNLS